MHSLGLAVDINPLLNPYLSASGVWLPDESHVDRSQIESGMFSEDHALVLAFVESGFEWGGSWERPDYHHFEWIL
jgi:excinuclease UvrABC helicase subunit UvrB